MSKLLSILGLCVLIVSTLGQSPLQEARQRGSPIPPRSRSSGLEKPVGIDVLEPRYRLNETHIPSNYKVNLAVLLDNDPAIGEQYTAPGTVKITFQPAKNSKEIDLHSNLLKIDEASVVVTDLGSADPITTVSVTYENGPEVHFLKVTVDKDLIQGQTYTIDIQFVAPISQDRLNGLYLSTYTDPISGEERRLAATQMESYHLRQLFPCFDEPNLKATFDVTVSHKSNYTALANSDLYLSVDHPTWPGWKTDTFRQTVKMSTYIFALVVSDFNYAAADPAIFPGHLVKVYGQPELINRGDGFYAAEDSARILSFLESYFDFPYPMHKMDSVAIPQFSAGAMENYGLNLYRISLLMYNQEETLESARYLVTNVLAHELAHQNFGNLVTCKWWTNIWLNEGFATYVSYLASQAVRPEFMFHEDQLNDAFQYSMVVDASDSTHPLLNDALTPSEIDNFFSGITYEKGGSVIRMVENFLTEKTMQKGLRYYLKDMAYKGSEQTDLFANLQKAAEEDNRLPAGVTIADILETWTLQPGYPLVRVSVENSVSVKITQERFTNHIVKALDPNDLWYIPVTIVTVDKPSLLNNVPDLWLTKTQKVETLTHMTSKEKWIMINQNATGYYRVQYDTLLTALIQDQLEIDPSVISPLSRSQLLDDYFTFAFQRYGTIQTAMEFTQYLANEDHFTVWDVVFTQLRKAYNLFTGNADNYAAFRDYMAPRIESALLKVGLEQSPDHIGAAAIYRSALLNWACAMEHPACFSYANKLFAKWMMPGAANPVPKDIQATMYCAIVASQGKTAEDFMLAKYKDPATTAIQKPLLLGGAACRKDAAALRQMVYSLVEPTSVVPAADATSFIQKIVGNPLARPMVVSFLGEKLKEIIAVIGNNDPQPVASIVTTLSTYLSTDTEIAAVTKFMADNVADLKPINDALLASLGTMQSNVVWMTEFGTPIVRWINGGTTTDAPTTGDPTGSTQTGSTVEVTTDPSASTTVGISGPTPTGGSTGSTDTTDDPGSNGAPGFGLSVLILAVASFLPIFNYYL